MGDVLGKECEKEETSFTHSTDDVIREDADGAASSGAGSESESDKVHLIIQHYLYWQLTSCAADVPE